jgi:methyl-accepting chemotaxis protein
MTENEQNLADENTRALYALGEAIFPLWAQNIEAARMLTNQSIEELSLKFGNLSQQIQHISQSNGFQYSEELVNILQQSKLQLTSIITLLKRSIDEKEELVKAISELASSTKSMGSMADNVTRISNETGMVAVNAAIEAARVGERGRGFAVVAEAVKRLSSDAGQTGKHISNSVEKITKAIQKVELHSKESALKDAETLSNAEQVVSNVLHEFSEIANKFVQSTNDTSTESKKVGQEIEQVLISLQFQDRVSQMLTHVHQDINKLNETIMQQKSIGNAGEWLDAFQSTYVMKEQHKIHQNRSMSAANVFSKPSNSDQQDQDEITFF